MTENTTITALRRMIKTELSATDVGAYIESLAGESDRGAIILGVTAIEDAVKTALVRHLGKLNSKDRDRVFGPQGPLGSFSNKLTFANALGLINDRDYRTANLFREIRNVAAHSHEPVNFDDPRIKAALQLNPYGLAVSHGKGFVDLPGPALRTIFLTWCAWIADFVLNDYQPTGDWGEVLKRVLLARGAPLQP